MRDIDHVASASLGDGHDPAGAPIPMRWAVTARSIGRGAHANLRATADGLAAGERKRSCERGADLTELPVGLQGAKCGDAEGQDDGCRGEGGGELDQSHTAAALWGFHDESNRIRGKGTSRGPSRPLRCPLDALALKVTERVRDRRDDGRRSLVHTAVGRRKGAGRPGVVSARVGVTDRGRNACRRVPVGYVEGGGASCRCPLPLDLGSRLGVPRRRRERNLAAIGRPSPL